MLKTLGLLATLLFASQSIAGLILYSDREQFESAVSTPLAFESFEDNVLEDVGVQSGYIRYRTYSSVVTDGDKALVLKEKNEVTFFFEHEVFAIGFDVNELNSSNLTYTDSAGNEIFNALEITEVWNASTFFGLTSDVGLTSFTLTGTGSTDAVYGIDAMQFTAAAVEVDEPWTLPLFALLFTGLVFIRRKFS